jgi:hypothetical protein
MIDISSTATDFGLSRYTPFSECVRRAVYFDSMRKPASEQQPPKEDYFLVGTMVHALLRHYRLGTVIEHDEQFSWLGTPLLDRQECRDEAFRLFNDYIKLFPREDFGTVVSTEEVIQIDDFMGTGVPLSGALDLVCEIKPEHVDAIRQTRQIDLLPGLYLVDDKTAGRNEPDKLIPKYRHSPQFQGYMHLWNHAHPDQRLMGTIVNVIIKTKKPQYLPIFVPDETATGAFMLRQLVSTASKHLNVYPDYLRAPTNPIHCVKEKNLCPLLTQRLCFRH